MLLEVSTETMSLFLKCFSAERRDGEHAVMVLDQTGCTLPERCGSLATSR